MTGNELRARNLRMLAALAGLFFLPLALAFWMYYATDWRPAGRVNHGELISPPRPLPNIPLPLVDLAPAGATERPAPPAASPSQAASPSPPLFHNRWSLVYISDGRCDESCRRALYVMRQTRLALNNDMTRVERVFLATGNCCAREFLSSEHAGLVVVAATDPQASRLLNQFPAYGTGRENSLYVVDPLGNLMMSYDARANPRGLLEDLKKLLRLSHIG